MSQASKLRAGALFAALTALSAVALVPTAGAGLARGIAEPVPPDFTQPIVENAGEATPVQFQIADFDNDGDNDIAEAIFARAGAHVLLGDGTGRFDDPILTPLPGTGASPMWTAAADFNRDGRMDLAALIISDQGRSLRFLRGKGDGTFAPGPDLGTTADRLRAGDLNEDGKPDLAVLDGANDRIEVHLGNGDGTFRPRTTYFFAGDDLGLADVNNDGHLDLLWSFGRMLVRLGRGDGTFGDFIDSFDPEHRLSGINFTLGDFDEDGNLDVAMDHGNPGHVQVGLGNGQRRFTPFAEYKDVAYQTFGIATADFTGDGHLDIVTNGDPYFGSRDFFILMRGRGDGTFRGFTRWVAGGEGVEVGDLNDDGKPDVVSQNNVPHLVFPTLNEGNGFFHTPQAYVMGGPATIVLQGDLNRDRRPDVIGPFDGSIGVNLNVKNRRFGPVIVSRGVDRILSLALADFNRDRKLDAVAGSFATRNIYLFRGRGDGRFAPPTGYGNGSGAAVLGVAAGDVDADGNPDVVSNTFGELSVRLGRGDGTLKPPIFSGAAGGFQVATLLGHCTGSPSIDAVSVIQTGSNDNANTTLVLNEGVGDGRFSVVDSLDVGTNVNEARGADFNGDGRLDVALVGWRGTHSGQTGLFVILVQPGAFGSPAHHEVGQTGLALADLNGDGSVDALTTCYFSTCGGFSIGAYVNRGNGTLVGPFGFSPVGQPYGIAAADFTGDGKPDFVELVPGSPNSAFAFYVNITKPSGLGV